MNSNYIVKLKNGEIFVITSDQNENLTKLLTREDLPEFINIDDNIVRADYIAYVKKESW